jgi:hypothetical protein
MTDPVLSAIEKERRALEARLEVLDKMERDIRRAPRPAGIPLVQPRAPHGLLRAAIASALAKSGAVTSAELKTRIRGNGYKHHINSQYFTKILAEMVADREVKKVPNGGYSTYELK